MAAITYSLPGCCSVGIMYYFFNTNTKEHIPTDPNDSPTSKNFIAIFSRNQKNSYDRVCKKHTLLSVTRVQGGHGTPLAICVFKWGKK